MLRQRRKVVKNLIELDAFPKIPETYTITSRSGGTISVLTFLVIIFLVMWEVSYFIQTKIIFKFAPDTDYETKLNMNIDITVAMPCRTIGADVLDVTNQNVLQFGQLAEEDTWFELDPGQRAHFDSVKLTNEYLREEFHSLQELFWRSGYERLFGGMPKRKEIPSRKHDACRIHGSLHLNKVAGNFHITAGKSIPLPRGHAHLGALLSDGEYNFSHRIDEFSFGDSSTGIIQPLEGDEKIADNSMMLYQYFVTVVQTEVNTYSNHLTTYQYAVRDQQRVIDHDKGSHGMAGIFFKYDFSALKVNVKEEHQSLVGFLLRLCGIVGGVYVTSGLINSVVQCLIDVIWCRYILSDPSVTAPPVETLVTSTVTPSSNLSLTTPAVGSENSKTLLNSNFVNGKPLSGVVLSDHGNSVPLVAPGFEGSKR